jgi:hypothetical protein
LCAVHGKFFKNVVQWVKINKTDILYLPRLINVSLTFRHISSLAQQLNKRVEDVHLGSEKLHKIDKQ